MTRPKFSRLKRKLLKTLIHGRPKLGEAVLAFSSQGRRPGPMRGLQVAMHIDAFECKNPEVAGVLENSSTTTQSLWRPGRVHLISRPCSARPPCKPGHDVGGHSRRHVKGSSPAPTFTGLSHRNEDRGGGRTSHASLAAAQEASVAATCWNIA